MWADSKRAKFLKFRSTPLLDKNNAKSGFFHN